MRKFFEEYKTLENKEVVVKDLEGPERAIEIVRAALVRYEKEGFGG